MEQQGWIEGANTPKPTESLPRTFPISKAAFETIAYAVRRWEQSGKVDFNMLFNFAEEVDGRAVLEFLAVWLY